MTSSLGRRIAKARGRVRPRVTQAQLAALLEVDVKTVNNWENDRVVPPPAMLGALEEALGPLDEDYVASPGQRVESEVTNADVLAAIKVMRQEIDERLGKVERAVFGGNEDADGP